MPHDKPYKHDEWGDDDRRKYDNHDRQSYDPSYPRHPSGHFYPPPNYPYYPHYDDLGFRKSDNQPPYEFEDRGRQRDSMGRFTSMYPDAPIYGRRRSQMESDPQIANWYDRNRKWMESSLHVGEEPSLADFAAGGKYVGHDTVINFSDDYDNDMGQKITASGRKYHWLPMSEKNANMSLHAIYAAMKIIHDAIKEGRKVLMHCKGQQNRSITIKNAAEYLFGGIRPGGSTRLTINCRNENLPHIMKTLDFLDSVLHTLQHDSKIQGNKLDWAFEDSNLSNY